MTEHIETTDILFDGGCRLHCTYCGKPLEDEQASIIGNRPYCCVRHHLLQTQADARKVKQTKVTKSKLP